MSDSTKEHFDMRAELKLKLIQLLKANGYHSAAYVKSEACSGWLVTKQLPDGTTRIYTFDEVCEYVASIMGG